MFGKECGFSSGDIVSWGERDLEAENEIRKQKKKKNSGPPIMKRDGF